MKLTQKKITLVMAGFIAAIFIMLPIAAAVSMSFDDRLNETNKSLEEINNLLARIHTSSVCPQTAEEMTQIVKGSTPAMWSRPEVNNASNVQWWHMSTMDDNGRYQPAEVLVEWGLTSSLGGEKLHWVTVGDHSYDKYTTPTGFLWGCVKVTTN